MATDVVTRIRARVAGANDVVTLIRVRAGGAGPSDVVTRIRARTLTATAFAVNILRPTYDLSPFEAEPLTAVPTQTPDTWLWSIDSGGGVLAGATTANPTFTAPALPIASTVVLRVTITKAGFSTVTDTDTFTVAPHAGRFRKDGSGVYRH